MAGLVSVYSRIVPILGNLSFDLPAQLRYNISCKFTETALSEPFQRKVFFNYVQNS